MKQADRTNDAFPGKSTVLAGAGNFTAVMCDITSGDDGYAVRKFDAPGPSFKTATVSGLACERFSALQTQQTGLVALKGLIPLGPGLQQEQDK
ncbi:hypothetical protein ACFQFQ_22465 [Sulfitobacter porphyrae]|uniref:Uncharacterized protein n=1 Tax=Sulfitobacter porphyrae TaxID=1246864 RepID=A0ABW2B7S4_9RHOB